MINDAVEAARHGRQVRDVPGADPALRLRRSVRMALAEPLAALEQRLAQLPALEMTSRESQVLQGCGCRCSC